MNSRARTIVTCLLTAAPIACGDSEGPVEPVEFTELCGTLGPVRLHEPPPGADRFFASRIDDRMYYSSGRQVDGDLVDVAVWTSGLCGESFTHLADDVGHPKIDERWPGLVFVCSGEHGHAALDLTGELHPVFASKDCGLSRTAHGAVEPVESDDGTYTLVLHPYPDDPRDGLVPSEPLGGPFLDYGAIREHEVHAITLEHTLIRIDLVDHSVTPLQTDVAAFRISRDGRWLAWLDSNTLIDSPDSPKGLLNLRDVESGVSVAIGEQASIGDIDLGRTEQGLLLFGPWGERRIYFLPSLEFIELPRGSALTGAGPLDGDRWLIENFEASPWLGMLDLEDGSITPLFTRAARTLEVQAEGVVVHDLPPCCVGAGTEDEGPLWYVPFSGAPRKLAERATWWSGRVDASRMLSGLDLDDSKTGGLALIDLDTGVERMLDEQVDARSWSIDRRDELTAVTYSVIDGERSGVWTFGLADPR